MKRKEKKCYSDMRSEAYVSKINLQHGTTAVENMKTTKQKDYRVKTDMLRSIGKQSGESVESVRKKKR